MGKHEFYQNHLSKSLPLVVRNGAKKWGILSKIRDSIQDASKFQSAMQ